MNSRWISVKQRDVLSEVYQSSGFVVLRVPSVGLILQRLLLYDLKVISS